MKTLPTCDELIEAVQVFEKAFDGKNLMTSMHAALTAAEKTRRKTGGKAIKVSWYVGSGPAPNPKVPGLGPLPFTIDT